MTQAPQIRIAMWGGPSSGKSTLAKALFNYIKSREPDHSIGLVREYATEWLTINSIADWVDNSNIQYKFAEEQVKREVITESDIMITDCPVPLCNYWAGVHPTLPMDKAKKLHKLTSFWASQYHVNVLLPEPNILYPYLSTDIRPEVEEAREHHANITRMYNVILADDTKYLVSSSNLIISCRDILQFAKTKGL